MADFKAVTNVSKDYQKSLSNLRKEQQAKEASTKAQYGYDDRVKALEGLGRSVLSTEQVLSQLPKDVTQRTAGRLVTEAQRRRILAKEQDPLTQQLANLSRSREAENQTVQMVRSLLGDINQDFAGRRSELGSIYDRRHANALSQWQAAQDAEREARNRAFQKELANIQLASMMPRTQGASAAGLPDVSGASAKIGTPSNLAELNLKRSLNNRPALTQEYYDTVYNPQIKQASDLTVGDHLSMGLNRLLGGIFNR